MIRHSSAGPGEIRVEAVLRSVYSDLTPDTPFSREVEVRAGPKVADRLAGMGELPVGAAVITPGGDLPSAFLIHVVLQSPEEPVRTETLRSALRNGLRRAQEWEMETLALPPLGTGAGNLEVEDSAAVMVSMIREHLRDHPHPRDVTLLLATEYERSVFMRALETVGDSAPAPGS